MLCRVGSRISKTDTWRIGTRRVAVLGTLCVLTACATTEVSTPPPAASAPPQWPVLSYNPNLILVHKNIAAVPQAVQRVDREITRRAQKFHQGPLPRPIVVSWRQRLQCVPFARNESKIALRGHAWHWWRAAKGKYRRGKSPQAGAVMVFKRNRRSRGHLAVVKRLINPRELVVNHANWLNKGRIHMNSPVRDISPNNDWSVVRVWYTPGRQYGSSRYRVKGFIYPELLTASR